MVDNHRRVHRLKHHSTWTPDPATTKDPPGWTSPTGRHYQPEHPDPQPPHWPQSLLPAEPQYPQYPQAQGLNAERPDATCNDVPCLNIHCPEAGLADLPPWEPDNERYVDLDDIPPDDPLWDEFLAASFVTRG